MEKRVLEKFIALAASCAVTVAGALVIFANSSLLLLGAGDSGGTTMSSVSPTGDSTSLLYNVNVGLQSTEVTGSSRTNPHGYPITQMNYRPLTRSMEATRDSYTLSALANYFINARADLQTVNLRYYDGDTGTCDIGSSAPAWMVTDADMGGWTATASSEGCGGTAYYYPNFEDADVVTEVQELINQIESTYAAYPAYKLGMVEFGYGMYQENTYSGTECVSTSGSAVAADSCSVGSEIAQYTGTELDGYRDMLGGLSISPHKLTFVDNENFFDSLFDNYASFGGLRADGFGWREVATANCPTTGPHMCGIYPRTFAVTTGSGQTASHSDVDTFAPVLLETWSTISSWDTNGWDYSSSLTWALTNGASVLNTKGQYDWTTSAIDTAMTTTLRTLGYRYQITNISNTTSVDVSAAPQNITVQITFENDGVAPDYDGQVWMVKLVEQGGGTPDVFYYTSSDTLALQSGASATDTLTVSVPEWLDAGTYDVYVGAGFDELGDDWPSMQFANDRDSDGDRWYQGGTLTVTNSSPTSNAINNYAADFENSNDEYLTIADADWNSFNGVDITACSRVKRESTGATNVIAAKGDVGAAGSQAWGLYFLNTDVLRLRTSNGTTSYALDTAATYTSGTWYVICFTYDNTSKERIIYVNNSNVASNSSHTGNIPNNSQAFTVGNDSTGAGTKDHDGLIDFVHVWKRKLSTTELTEVYDCAVTTECDVSKYKWATRRGLYVGLDLDEVSGNRTDNFHGTIYTDTNTVMQGSAQ